MKRKASAITKQKKQHTVESRRERNRRDVSFSKRRKGLFTKASKFCMMFGAEMAILVLSPAGRPYSFGHSSVYTVLSRYIRLEEVAAAAPNYSVGGFEGQVDKIQGLKNQLRNKRKREEPNDIDVKEWFEKELKACQTLQDMVMLRDRYLVLLQNVKKRLRITSPDFEHVKAQDVSTKLTSIYEDMSPNSTLDSQIDHRAADYNNNVFDDPYKPTMLSGADVSPNSTLDIQSDIHHVVHNPRVLDDHHKPISIYVDISPYSTLDHRSTVDHNHHAVDHHAEPISTPEDIPPESTLSKAAVDDQHRGNNGDEGSFSWEQLGLVSTEAVNENYSSHPFLPSMVDYFLNDSCDGGLNGGIDVSPPDMVGPSTNAALDAVGSTSDFTQHESAVDRYSSYLENIINDPSSYQDSSFQF